LVFCRGPSIFGFVFLQFYDIILTADCTDFTDYLRKRNMPDIKSQMKYKVFLGVILLLGGIISILIPAWKLEGSSTATIIMGVTFVMLGDSFLWEAIRDLRERKKEKQEIKDTQKK
jgi:hypothetical protein